MLLALSDDYLVTSSINPFIFSVACFFPCFFLLFFFCYTMRQHVCSSLDCVCLFACCQWAVWFVSEGIFEWQLLMFLLLNGKKIWTCICQCSLSFSLPFDPCSSALQTAAPPPVTKLVSEACYECLTTCYPFYSILSLSLYLCVSTLSWHLRAFSNDFTAACYSWE